MIIDNLGKIISGIGIPFFIMMIFGIVVFTIKDRDKKIFSGTAIFIILFMFVWRGVVPGFYSSRYALTLSIIAMLFDAYLLVTLRRSSWLLLSILVVAFTCKNLMIDDGGKWIINVSNAIVDSVGTNENAVILVPGRDFRRIEFYSGYPCLKVRGLNDGDIDPDTLNRLLSNQYADNIFVCEKVKVNKKTLTKEAELPGSWELIYSELFNKKRKLECRLYRFRKNKAAEKFIPVPGNNLIANGDFKIFGEPSAQQQKIFEEKQLKYFIENKLLMPEHWIIDSERPYNNCAAGIIEGISGRRTLMLQAVNYACLLRSENGFTSKYPVKIQCRAQCSIGTEILFTIRSKEAGNSCDEQNFFMSSVKVVRDQEALTYSFIFDPLKFGVPGQTYFVEIAVWNGRMNLDEITAVEIR